MCAVSRSISNYALRGLLSVEYLITTPEKQEDFLAEADDGWTYYDTEDGFMLYENENYVPMGFTYDYYITEESYEATIRPRANLLMRALVLSEEDAKAYGKYLTELPDAKLDELYYDTYVAGLRRPPRLGLQHLPDEQCRLPCGDHAEEGNLVFFSVPYDDGFTAYVNGEETDIVRVDEGLMAVLCPAGANSIDFVYQADGIRLSRVVTLGGHPGMAGVHGLLCAAQAPQHRYPVQKNDFDRAEKKNF